MASLSIDRPEDAGRGFTDVALPSLDGTALRGRFWTHPRSRGVLLIAHGLGEHGGSYRRVADQIVADLEIDVLAVDFRGSGRSSGKRGVIGSYEDLLDDLEAANRWASKERPGLPRFLFGHSNGGLVALRAVLDRCLDLRGLIVSNPSLRLLTTVPVWKKWVAELLIRVAPDFTLSTGLTNDQLTHDPIILEEIAGDTLRHTRICPPMYFGMIRSGPIALAKAPEIRVPTLVIVGGSDPIIDPEASRLLFRTIASEDKSLLDYPEMRHEPLNEVGRARVLQDIEGWIEARLDPRA